jgi:hypothetical protein
MSFYRSGSVTTLARELARYKLDLVGVQGVRWNERGTVRAGDYFSSIDEETKIINGEQDFFVHHRIVTAGKRVEFVSGRK